MRALGRRYRAWRPPSWVGRRSMPASWQVVAERPTSGGAAWAVLPARRRADDARATRRPQVPCPAG